MEMKTCPVCKEQLDTAVFHNTVVDYCGTCLGMFFDEDELRLARDDMDESLSWYDVDLWRDADKLRTEQGSSKKLCPACRLPLYQVRYGESDVQIDTCRSCRGLWLDRGEFHRIIAYLKERTNWEVLHNFSKRLADETWEIFTGPKTLREELADTVALLKVLTHKFPDRENETTQ